MVVGGSWYIIYVAVQAEYVFFFQQRFVATHAQARVYQMAQSFHYMLQHLKITGGKYLPPYWRSLFRSYNFSCQALLRSLWE
jgi:hypothetical protein